MHRLVFVRRTGVCGANFVPFDCRGVSTSYAPVLPAVCRQAQALQANFTFADAERSYKEATLAAKQADAQAAREKADAAEAAVASAPRGSGVASGATGSTTGDVDNDSSLDGGSKAAIVVTLVRSSRSCAMLLGNASWGAWGHGGRVKERSPAE